MNTMLVFLLLLFPLLALSSADAQVASGAGDRGVYGQMWRGALMLRFVDYTAELNWFLPTAVIPALATIATLLKVSSVFSLF